MHSPIGARYHTGIEIIDDNTGAQYAIAFFPSGNEDYVGLAFSEYWIVGAIVHGPTFPNEESMPVVQVVVRNGCSANHYIRLAKKIIKNVNQTKYAYEAARQNSNTAARYLLIKLGLRPPTPYYDTPAWGNTLTDIWHPYPPMPPYMPY